MYVNRLKISIISHDIDDMDLVGNDVDTLHEKDRTFSGSLCIHIYEFDLHVFYYIRSSKKISKVVEEKLIFGYIVEELTCMLTD